MLANVGKGICLGGQNDFVVGVYGLICWASQLYAIRTDQSSKADTADLMLVTQRSSCMREYT
jgi:hypothetical protein